MWGRARILQCPEMIAVDVHSIQGCSRAPAEDQIVVLPLRTRLEPGLKLRSPLIRQHGTRDVRYLDCTIRRGTLERDDDHTLASLTLDLSLHHEGASLEIKV
jgi:hypothetical protein